MTPEGGLRLCADPGQYFVAHSFGFPKPATRQVPNVDDRFAKSGPMQFVEHEEGRFYDGQWLDKWDRRVRRAQVLIDWKHALEKMKATRRRVG